MTTSRSPEFDDLVEDERRRGVVAPRHLRTAAHAVGEEIARRHRFGFPVPHELVAAHAALIAAGRPGDPGQPLVRTTKDLARQWNCSVRTAQRRARSAGGVKVGSSWTFT